MSTNALSTNAVAGAMSAIEASVAATGYVTRPLLAATSLVSESPRAQTRPRDETLTEHVLDDVVPVLVLDQLFNVRVKFVQDGGRLFRGAVLQDSLDHPAAVRVSRQGKHLAGDRELR